jgi:hypothetical protein
MFNNNNKMFDNTSFCIHTFFSNWKGKNNMDYLETL